MEAMARGVIGEETVKTLDDGADTYTIGTMMDTVIARPEFVQPYMVGFDLVEGRSTWSDFVLLEDDPLMGGALHNSLNLTLEGDDAAVEDAKKIFANSTDDFGVTEFQSSAHKRWNYLRNQTVRQMLVDNNKIYDSVAFKPFALGQADKENKDRGLNSWQQNVTLGEDGADYGKDFVENVVRANATKNKGKNDLLKIRVFDLLMLKMLHDTFLDLEERLWPSLGSLPAEVRSPQEGTGVV